MRHVAGLAILMRPLRSMKTTASWQVSTSCRSRSAEGPDPTFSDMGPKPTSSPESPAERIAAGHESEGFARLVVGAGPKTQILPSTAFLHQPSPTEGATGALGRRQFP